MPLSLSRGYVSAGALPPERRSGISFVSPWSANCQAVHHAYAYTVECTQAEMFPAPA